MEKNEQLPPPLPLSVGMVLAENKMVIGQWTCKYADNDHYDNKNNDDLFISAGTVPAE